MNAMRSNRTSDAPLPAGKYTFKRALAQGLFILAVATVAWGAHELALHRAAPPAAPATPSHVAHRQDVARDLPKSTSGPAAPATGPEHGS